jgi:hypothetical protein
MWVKEQKKSSGPEPYAKTTATVITPDRQTAEVSMDTPQGPKPKDMFSQEIMAILDPWEKSSLLKQRVLQKVGAVPDDYLTTKIKDKGDQNWVHFELGFNANEIVGKEDQILDAVKAWAAESHVGGKMGPRAALVYDWHTDGNKPHIRVALNGLPWDETTGGTPERVKHGNLDVIKGNTHTGMLSKGSEVGEEMMALAETMKGFGIGVHAYGRNYSQNLGLIATPGVSASVTPIQNAIPSANEAEKTGVGTIPRAGLAPTNTGLDALEGAQLSAIAKIEQELNRTRQALEQTQMAKQALLDKAAMESALQDALGNLTKVRTENEGLSSTLDATTQARDQALVQNSELSETLTSTQGELETATSALVETNDLLEQVTTKLEETTQRATVAEQCLAETSTKLTETEAARAKAAADASDALNRATTAEGLVATQAQTIKVQQGTIDTTNQALEKERLRNQQVEGQLTQARTQIDQQRETMNKQADELAVEKRERASVVAEVVKLTPLVAENASLKERAEAVELENANLQKRVQDAEAKRDELANKLKEENLQLANLTTKYAEISRSAMISQELARAMLGEGVALDANVHPGTAKSLIYGMLEKLLNAEKDGPLPTGLEKQKKGALAFLEDFDSKGVMTYREEKELADAKASGEVVVRFADIMTPRRRVDSVTAKQLQDKQGAMIVTGVARTQQVNQPEINRPRIPRGPGSDGMDM